MKISPISSFNFGRKANAKEIENMFAEKNSAKKKYECVVDKTFLQVEGGIKARQNARDYGFEYAKNHKEGNIYKAGWEHYVYNHANHGKNLAEKKDAHEIFMVARKSFMEKVHEGAMIYFATNEEDGKVAREVFDRAKNSKEGIEALQEVENAENKLQSALNGEDIFNEN